MLQHSAAALAAVAASALCPCFGICRCFGTLPLLWQLSLLRRLSLLQHTVVASALQLRRPTTLISQFASVPSPIIASFPLFLLYFSLTKKILYRKRGKAVAERLKRLLWQLPLLQHSAAALAAVVASALCRCFSTLPLLWQLLQHSAAALAAVVALVHCSCFGSCRCFGTLPLLWQLSLLWYTAAALAAVVASAL
jgi:hypothetical protein